MLNKMFEVGLLTIRI